MVATTIVNIGLLPLKGIFAKAYAANEQTKSDNRVILTVMIRLFLVHVQMLDSINNCLKFSNVKRLGNSRGGKVLMSSSGVKDV